MRNYGYLSFLLGALISVPVFAAEPNQKAPEPCVEVQIGQDTATRLSCLNNELQRTVEHTQNTPQAQIPLNAQSDSNKVGTFNDVAARQKMGNAYGVSAQPQRPKNVFVSPLLPSAKP